MSQRRTLSLCLAGLLLLAFGPAAWAATHTVTVGPGTTFSPKTLNIQVGDRVVWTNVGGGEHDVMADNGSFGFGPPSTEAWEFDHTFTSAGSFGYHCTLHGRPGSGMSGTVNVSAGSGGGSAGTIGFSAASYSVNEGTATLTITAQRTGGDDGAVSVQYATSNGTASAGADYTAASGTLSWANSDDANKTFTVTINNDTANEGNETFTLTLSNPTGGATLNTARRVATVTIQDNDGGGGGGGTPSAPTGLTAAAESTSEILLNWTDASSNETGFRIERRTLTGTYQEIASVGANTTSHSVTGLSPATQHIFRVRAVNGANFSPYSNEAAAATNATPGPCVESSTALCINGDRFKVEVAWRTAQGLQGAGFAVPLDFAPDSGLFYFFSQSNIELLIKILNACGLNDSYWVFYAATTNVQMTITVTDTQSGRVKVYFNPLNQTAAPVTDTSAFATCP